MRMGLVMFVGWLLSFSGCSLGDSQKGQRLRVYPVTGSVTMSSQPVDKAMVIFVGPDGSTARGTTNAEGDFTLTTFEANDGAVAGPQQVAIVKEEAGYDPNQLKIGQAPPTSGSNKSALPKIYADPKTSGLTVTVSEDAPNEFGFDLTEKPE